MADVNPSLIGNEGSLEIVPAIDQRIHPRGSRSSILVRALPWTRDMVVLVCGAISQAAGTRLRVNTVYMVAGRTRWCGACFWHHVDVEGYE